MFNKKCERCKNSLKKGYDYCPFCGYDVGLSYNREDYGILGKTDAIEEEMPMEGSMMDKMFNSAFRMAEKIIEKQMKSISEEMMQNQNKPRNPEEIMPGMNVQFFVNGKRVHPQNGQPAVPMKKQQPIRVENNFSSEKVKDMQKLPRKEAISKIRRLSGKIIYELEVPGVNDLNDVLINQLENSIEIKAVSGKEVFHKTLNVNLPILRYGLDNGNLFLELAAK